MKYIILSADYHSEHCLRHEFTGDSALRDIVINAMLKERIRDWNERYFAIIGGDPAGRQSMADTISALDNEGIAIARSIQEESPERIKIKYYSEGLMRHLVVQGVLS